MSDRSRVATTPAAARCGPSLVVIALAGLVADRGIAQPELRRLDLADEADLRFELGVEAHRRGDCRTALTHYHASNRLAYNRNVVFNVARCYEQLGRYAEAYRYYADYLDETTDAEERRTAERALERIRPHVALVRVETQPPGATLYVDRRELGSRGQSPRTLALSPEPHRILAEIDGHEPAWSEPIVPRVGELVTVELVLERILGEVHVTGGPSGARIRVEDEPSIAGTVPGTISLPPGAHVLTISAPGHRTVRERLQVEARRTMRLEVSLPPLTGTLVVDDAESGALIELDGRQVGFTPAVLRDVPAGEHLVRVLRPGFRPFEQRVRIEPDASVTVDASERLEREVTAVTRRAEGVERAPASVTLITAEEIAAFGYSTLWDAAGGTRGVYQTDDLTYASLGFRGFSSPTDYGNRVLVLMDGHTMNDDLLGGSYVGYDARGDLLDVRRIEIVRGPGSALYGTNAFFGVINVVTADRDEVPRPHASVATDGTSLARLRLGGGHALTDRIGGWASLTGVLSQGRSLYFPEFEPPRGPGGTVRDADGFEAYSGTARAWIGPLTVQGHLVRRRKRIPTGAFDTILGDPRTQTTDTRAFVELRYESAREGAVRPFGRVSLDHYAFAGDYAHDPPGAPDPDVGVTHDRWSGWWASAEARLSARIASGLEVTAGAEGRQGLIGRLRGSDDVSGVYLDEDGRGTVLSGYALGEIDFGPHLAVTAGGRVDWFSLIRSGAFSPRLALVAGPWPGGTVKLVGGSAFRAPSVYELRYNDGGVTQLAAERLAPERIWTVEVEATHRFGDGLSLIGAAYYNRIGGLVGLVDVPDGDPSTNDPFRYANRSEQVQTVGIETEIVREWRRGWMVAASVSLQRTRRGDLLSDDVADRVPNSPEHMAAVKVAAPLFAGAATLAVRLRAEAPRLRILEGSEGPVALRGRPTLLGDVTLSGRIGRERGRWAIGVRNLFDWRYGHPGGEDLRQAFVPQPGRTFYFELTLHP
ncbi:MAG: TonB-dependent receptor [Myxococcota bacterium]|nr:TonB-dependent receptor [Myxococcota bacterium]